MQNKIKKELPKQFDFIDIAKQRTLDWAKTKNIKLFRIEFVIPFVLTGKSLAVYLFFDTNKLLDEYYTDGTTQKVKGKYLESLTQINYPIDYLNEITFIFDSDENVQKNYEGSYFYRLR